ncbi:MAG: hypothetical protein SGBAC_012634 [Bacillariaceae sp.]
MGSDKKTDDIGPALLPLEKAKTEESARQGTTKALSIVAFVVGPIIGWALYFINKALISEESQSTMDIKFDFLHAYQLHYVYIAMFMAYLAKFPLMINAGASRGPTRVDRPDQHIYQVVGTEQLVLMATDGAYGRFNRAQRANMNMDESLAQFLANTLLVAPILGTICCYFLLPLYAYGRISFAHAYKVDTKSRAKGFLMSMIAEHVTAALVGIIAIKAMFGASIPV